MDRVSIGALRRAEPELFTCVELHKGTFGPADTAGLSAFSIEVRIAERAFARTLGTPDPHPGENRDVYLEALEEAYEMYGLSSGVQQTKQLVRGIERAAASQAKGTAR